MNKNKLFASVIGLLVFVTGLSAKDYQVAMFGIKSDGVTLNTRSIQRAVDYISEQVTEQRRFVLTTSHRDV